MMRHFFFSWKLCQFCFGTISDSGIPVRDTRGNSVSEQRDCHHIPIVTRYGETSVSTAAKPAPTVALLHVLLVGNKEEDFYLIREMLDLTRSLLARNSIMRIRWRRPRKCCNRKPMAWFCSSTKPETPRRFTLWLNSCIPECRSLSSC